MFSVRAVVLDYYLAKPIDEMFVEEDVDREKPWQEPVLRVFGPTPEGATACVHVHGVYPYIYVPYWDDENPERDALLLGAALDEALKTSTKQKNFRFVHKVSLMSGTPLYGYHSKEKTFLKIFFYNPIHIKRASECLLSGAILDRKLQPHEAHIPYTLQFMMDYNIYGMSFITFSKIKYRQNPNHPDSLCGVNEEDILSNKVKKIACSYFEVDAWGSDIKNRVIGTAGSANPGLQAIWEDERKRRRAQNRVSQISAPVTQTRPTPKDTATEKMYKERLARKLRAVIPLNAEASIAPSPPSDRKSSVEDVLDASALINLEILSQVQASEKEESEEEITEADSVLGRNPKEDEKVEPDDDGEGVDMTQPLNLDEILALGAEDADNSEESGESDCGPESEFWKEMADKIFQLDGAQDSSSESEGESTRCQKSQICTPEKNLEYKSTLEATATDHQSPCADLEITSNWSNGILSILSEDARCPEPPSLCQTPQSFWSSYSPKMDCWLAQTQEPWPWGRTEPLTDCFSEKTQTETVPDFVVTVPNSTETNSLESFSSFLSSKESPESPFDAVFSPSTFATPSETEAPSEGATEIGVVEPCVRDDTVLSHREPVARSEEREENGFTDALKSFAEKVACKKGQNEKTVPLTLKEYIRDCDEIVKVDFKNICDREMVVIEYKSTKSKQSKFLIKPLDKFLDQWNVAEKKLNNMTKKTKGFENCDARLAKDKELNNRVKQSEIKSIKNKLSPNLIEVPGGKQWNVRHGKSYKVNENVISKGKITMKLIKSNKDARKLTTSEAAKKNVKESFDCRYYSDVKTSKVVKSSEDNRRTFSESSEIKNRETEMNVFCSHQFRRNKGKPKEDPPERKWTKRKSFSENDTKLINEINSSFEEYFRNIVKANSSHGRNEKTWRSSAEDEGSSEEESSREATKEKNRSKRNSPDPDFVSRFLSTFSQLSQSSDVPLSITITVGDSCKSRPLPVEVSFRPPVEKKRRKRSKRRKMKMCFVDGPVDSSSDESELESFSQKKMKREGVYKPLRVVLRSRSDRRIFGREEGSSEESDGHCRVSSTAQPDRFDCYRQSPKPSPRTRVLRSSLQNVTPKSSVKKGKSLGSTWLRSLVQRRTSTDFIYDSDEELSRKMGSGQKQKELKNSVKKIPQVDVVVSSSENESASPSCRQSSNDSQKSVVEVEQVNTDVLDNCEETGKPEEGETQGSNQSDGTSADLFSSASLPEQLQTPEDSTPVKPRLSLEENTATQGEPLPLVFSQQNTPEFCSSESNPSPRVSYELSGDSVQKFSPEEHTFLDSSEQTWCQDSGETPPSFSGVTSITGRKTITPLQKPPPKKEAVEYLSREGIQINLAGTPFYSDPTDSTEAMRAGPRVLKVESDFIGTLKPFKSFLETIVGTEQRRLMRLNFQARERHMLVGGRDITIVPLKKPPSRAAVAKWLECPKEGRKENTEKAKKKIVRPASPGQESDSDAEIDLSLSLSVCVGDEKSEKASPLEKVSGGEEALSVKEPLTKGPSDKIKGIKRQKISPEAPLDRRTKDRKQSSDSFQIEGVSCQNTFGFENSAENLQNVKLSRTHQFLTVLTMELHVQTREDLRPDPQIDPIRALFYSITFDSPTRDSETGIITVGDQLLDGTGISCKSVHYVSTESELIRKIIDLAKAWDPDILAGYEIEMHSWGYLIQRGFVLEMNLFSLLGRIEIEERPSKDLPEVDDEFDAPRSIRRMRISGRIVLDVWRLLRHEAALTSYTFENVMYHLCQERVPLLSYKTLSYYWEHPGRRLRHIAAEHYLTRVTGVIELLDRLDFIDRTSELSRIFGIQFYEVLSRGSQFRVESMMLRLAKPLGYVPASPSIAQRAEMRAPASLPLILEPESLFYTDPVIVLDFQSLYPSIIIAYNYCFSTCLGRVEKLGSRDPFEFGCTQLTIPPEELKNLEKNITISPAGVAFVNSSVRKGVLPNMLEEILETRLMVKKSMKENKNDRLLQKVLFARQLGLKLIANVTYGYTAANFSGRMPCIEVGDSVVSKGRETLERAIRLVNETREWEAKVVYGDTDSIFVLTPGKTREEAFRIGAEIAEAVTLDNPRPVKLKLEKVYQPCILQTKKRYAGYMYESPGQPTPVFEAKGIETVRRDGCPAVGKILEKSLRILFDTRDVSLVKRYAIRQFAKLFQGRVNIQDLIFAKEYRGRRGYRPGACVPALTLARQWTMKDKRAEPRVKERVPYVIVNGPPRVPLIRLVRSPADLISDPSLRINAAYYITKAIIPPMQRCFSLLGVDVTSWYSEVPRKYRKMQKASVLKGQRKATISQYFSTSECVSCSEITIGPICPECERKPQTVVIRLNEKVRRWERCHSEVTKVCQACCGRPTELDCRSIDCPVFFRKHQALRDFERVPTVREILTYL